MHAYRFRVLSEENEDFLLDIEVKATQTFLDFHLALKSFCNITNNELASFFVCDDKWRRKSEIILVDMGVSDEDTKQSEQSEKKPVMVMEKVKLNQIIIDPHQRFMYIYDFMHMHTFYIELTHIKPTIKTIQYPSLIKKEGEINFNTSASKINLLLEDEELGQIPDLDEDDPFFGQEADGEDLGNLETDIFYGTEGEN